MVDHGGAGFTVGLDSGVVASILVMAPALAFAAGGGIGGGAIIVPVMIFIAQIPVNFVVAGANLVIFAGALVNVAFALPRRRPDGSTLIDYSVVVALEPATIAGGAAGALVSRMVGPAFITTLMVGVLAATAWRTLSRYRSLRAAAVVDTTAVSSARSQIPPRSVGGVVVARAPVGSPAASRAPLLPNVQAGVGSDSPLIAPSSQQAPLSATSSTSDLLGTAGGALSGRLQDGEVPSAPRHEGVGDGAGMRGGSGGSGSFGSGNTDGAVWEPGSSQIQHRILCSLRSCGAPESVVEAVAGSVRWLRFAFGPKPTSPSEAEEARAALRPYCVWGVPWLWMGYLAIIVAGAVAIALLRAGARDSGEITQCRVLLGGPIAWGVLNTIITAWVLVRLSAVEALAAAADASEGVEGAGSASSGDEEVCSATPPPVGEDAEANSPSSLLSSPTATATRQPGVGAGARLAVTPAGANVSREGVRPIRTVAPSPRRRRRRRAVPAALAPSACAAMVWTPIRGVAWPSFCALAGLFAGLFGIGGGILKVCGSVPSRFFDSLVGLVLPFCFLSCLFVCSQCALPSLQGPFLLEMGLHPEAASATTAAMILVTSTANIISYSSFGLMSVYSHSAIIALLLTGLISTFIGQAAITAYLRRTGQAHLIVLVIGVVVAVSAVAMCAQSVVLIAKGTKSPFRRSLCGE